MKALVIGFIGSMMLTLATPVLANPHEKHGYHQPRHHGYHQHHHRHHAHRWHHRNDWIVPAIIGGAVVYAATRPDPVIVQQPQIVLQPNQVIIDGIVYTRQWMLINGVYQEVLVRP